MKNVDPPPAYYAHACIVRCRSVTPFSLGCFVPKPAKTSHAGNSVTSLLFTYEYSYDIPGTCDCSSSRPGAMILIPCRATTVQYLHKYKSHPRQRLANHTKGVDLYILKRLKSSSKHEKPIYPPRGVFTTLVLYLLM